MLIQCRVSFETLYTEAAKTDSTDSSFIYILHTQLCVCARKYIKSKRGYQLESRGVQIRGRGWREEREEEVKVLFHLSTSIKEKENPANLIENINRERVLTELTFLPLCRLLFSVL